MSASKSQLRANKEWKHRNKLQNRRNTYKSTCKNYILNWCDTPKQLDQVDAWSRVARRKLK